jgi:hypothetical protein
MTRIWRHAWRVLAEMMDGFAQLAVPPDCPVTLDGLLADDP